MQQEQLTQKIDSYMSVILVELQEKDYREYIKNNSLLEKYDTLMSNFEEKNIPYELLEQVYDIVKNKVKSL